MLRGLLLALVLCTSAVPAGACVFELLHTPHDHADSPDGDDDCPCHCKLTPRVTTAPAPPALEGDSTALPLTVAELSIPALSLVSFRAAPPPGPDPARPRYLAVARLLL